MEDNHTFDRVKSDSDYSKLDPVECISEADEKRLERARCLVADLMPFEFDLSKPPPPFDPVVKLAGCTVGTPGNLLILSGQAKSGKTRIGVGGILSAALSGKASIGWEVFNPRNHAILHIDSEQGEYHWDLLNRDIARRCGSVNEFPDNFRSWRMVGIEPHRLRDHFGELLYWSKHRFGGVRLALIDGFTDMLEDVNNLAESVRLRVYLQQLATEFKCLIGGIVHSNQGSDSINSRGHIGKELERKCEASIPFARSGEIISAHTSYARNEYLSKDKGPRWQWDTGSHNFELLDPATIKPPGPSATYTEAADALRGHPPLVYAQAKGLISTACKISPDAAEKRLKRALEQGLISKDIQGRYLIPETTEL